MSQEQNFIEITSSPLGSYSYCPTCGIEYGNDSSFCMIDGTKLVTTTKELKKRTLFAEKYEILEHLGTGGMGAVYKVRQILIDKIYALKIIPADLITEQLASRFEREARTMATLENQNLVSIVDFGIWQKQPFMVMELIEGKTLASIIASGPIDTEQVVSVFRQVLNGLSHAHSKGFLHRDIKPSNIMIYSPSSSKVSDSAVADRSGELAETCRAVILDFGIAKKFGIIDHKNDASSLDLTRTGEMIGSPLYMSPEQARGDNLTPSSDLYSLGCALYESLCGTPPFIGKTPIETMILHLGKEPLPMKEASLGRDYSPGLERVVRKLLAKDPADRYQSADEVKRALYLAHQLDEFEEKSQ
ncbi:MAG: serine/threonine protein kinase, partial [Leptolyngbya sp.]|nr:serine/threonine protein kinase [Candidatus Melainabacteria bacterium]